MIAQHRDDQTPAPQTVAAWFVLGTAASERVPWWAAQWLADGHDGTTLRELAGLNGHDPRAVGDLLPEALAEMGVTLPTTTTAAATEAFRHTAEMHVSGLASERWVAQQVEQIVAQASYDNEVLDLPLGRLYGLEDAWSGGWGPSVAEMEADVRARCAEQLSAR